MYSSPQQVDTDPDLQWEIQHNALVVIGGLSCAGKTTLANGLRDVLKHVIIYNQDKFFRNLSPEERTLAERGIMDFDKPSQYDSDAIVARILETIERPEFVCNACRSTGSHVQHIIAFEGIHGLSILHKHRKKLRGRGYALVAIFLDSDVDVARDRRALRRYGPLSDPPGYFDSCVVKHHQTELGYIEENYIRQNSPDIDLFECLNGREAMSSVEHTLLANLNSIQILRKTRIQ